MVRLLNERNLIVVHRINKAISTENWGERGKLYLKLCLVLYSVIYSVYTIHGRLKRSYEDQSRLEAILIHCSINILYSLVILQLMEAIFVHKFVHNL